MALLTVTLGVNQHVAGIGTTLLLVAACDFTNRLLFGGGERPSRRSSTGCSPAAGSSRSTR